MYHKQARADVLPDFYETIAKMDYFPTKDSDPKQILAQLEADQPKHQKQQDVFDTVPFRFTSEDNYIALWEKLFFQEARAQIIRSINDQMSPPEELQFVSFSTKQPFKILSFKRVKASPVTYLAGWLVLVSPEKVDIDIIQLHQDVSTQPCLLGFVEYSEALAVKVLLNQSLKEERPQDWDLFTSSKRWYVRNVCALATLQREYKALSGFKKLPNSLKEVILRPDQHKSQAAKRFGIPLSLQNHLRKSYNDSQFKAITESLKQQGFTLIQGPPGTGKTRTVLGTLSVLLNSHHKSQDDDEPLILQWRKSQEILQRKSSRTKCWLEKQYSNWRDEPYITNEDSFFELTKKYIRSNETDRKIQMPKKQQELQLPLRVLICGPSNASVDQIIRKLLKDKLNNEDGETYLPRFVRVGENYDESLKQYSLQSVAISEAAKDKSNDLNFYRTKVLKQQKIVFATLSAAGSAVLQASSIEFDTVIIDEAGQSIELSSLIPLLYGCKRIILIGDPNQLPATVFSRKCLHLKYDQSLFQRMMKCNYPVTILRTQYRMHPQISNMIGTNFYGGLLLNNPHTIIKQPKYLPHSFMMFHVMECFQSHYHNSYRNIVESRCVKIVVEYVGKQERDIGIVSPYSAQVELLIGLGLGKKYEVKTIDSFQGREKNVVIFSGVRASFVSKHMYVNRRRTIGFVADMRRVNVSLSRAKDVCIVVGDLNRLASNSTWRKIIVDAIEKGQAYQMHCNKDYFKGFMKDLNKHRFVLQERKGEEEE